LPAGVLVPGVCALSQFVDLAAPGQPAGQLPPCDIITQIGEHAHHVYVAQLGPPACE
jgi:hypothetical protein